MRSPYVAKRIVGTPCWAVGRAKGGWIAQGMSERTARRVARLLNADEEAKG